jgi:hypothetical protein
MIRWRLSVRYGCNSFDETLANSDPAFRPITSSANSVGRGAELILICAADGGPGCAMMSLCR